MRLVIGTMMLVGIASTASAQPVPDFARRQIGNAPVSPPTHEEILPSSDKPAGLPSYGPDYAAVFFKQLAPAIENINHGLEPVDAALVPVSKAVAPLTGSVDLSNVPALLPAPVAPPAAASQPPVQ